MMGNFNAYIQLNTYDDVDLYFSERIDAYLKKVFTNRKARNIQIFSWKEEIENYN